MRVSQNTVDLTLSVPRGFTEAGLPMGSPIIGGMWDEAGMLDAGHACEQATGWHLRRPAIAG